MIALDTNILVYAHRADSKLHETAKAFINRLASGHETWCIPWACIHEFLSIVTNQRIFKNGDATPIEKALAQVDEWISCPSMNLISENENHWKVLGRLIKSGSSLGPLVHDARVFAVCESQGIDTLYTNDRDFSKFAGNVSIKNPLI